MTQVMLNKPEMACRFYTALQKLCECPEQGVDIIQIIQHMGGVLVEVALLFDDPADAFDGCFVKLAGRLNTPINRADIGSSALPPAHVVDSETERGRTAARIFLEDWADCPDAFFDLVATMIEDVAGRWEADGHMPKAEMIHLLYTATRMGLSYEIAAQELCDIVIENHVAQRGWSLGDCIGALSAVAGRRLAQSLNAQTCMIFQGSAVPENLDCIVYVMTKEAVRLGVPAGSDWRFGLAANDMPVNAPVQLIQGVEPHCEEFFGMMQMHDDFYMQAVSLAKAAGRMVAVASGGDLPEIEPAIAKPLAMSAMTESYKFVCIDHNLLSAHH